MAFIAPRFTSKQFVPALRTCYIKILARPWNRGGNGQLIELQRRQLWSDSIILRRGTEVTETIPGRDWKLRRIIQSRVEKRPLSVHLEVGNESIPIANCA